MIQNWKSNLGLIFINKWSVKSILWFWLFLTNLWNSHRKECNSYNAKLSEIYLNIIKSHTITCSFCLPFCVFLQGVSTQKGINVILALCLEQVSSELWFKTGFYLYCYEFWACFFPILRFSLMAEHWKFNLSIIFWISQDTKVYWTEAFWSVRVHSHLSILSLSFSSKTCYIFKSYFMVIHCFTFSVSTK